MGEDRWDGGHTKMVGRNDSSRDTLGLGRFWNFVIAVASTVVTFMRIM